MKIVDRIKLAYKGFMGEETNKDNAYLQVWERDQAFGGLSGLGWQIGEERPLLWKMFADKEKGHVVVSSIVRDITRAMVELMQQHVEIVDDDGEVVDNAETKAIWEKLYSPNDMDNMTTFTTKMAYGLLVVGDGFIYRNSPTFPTKGELFVIPPHKISIALGTLDKPIRGFGYSGQIFGQNVVLTPENTIMFAQPNTDDTTFYGLSPLLTALKDLETMDVGKLLRKEQLGDGGPQNILSPKKDMEIDPLGQVKDNEEVLADSVQRVLKNRKVKNLVLSASLENIALGTTAVSLGVQDTITDVENTICSAYNYPIDRYRGQSTYNNQQQARLEIYSIAAPYLEIYLGGLYRVFDMKEKKCRFAINQSIFEKLRQDITADLAAMEHRTTLNEQRVYLGYEPVEGGDVLFRPLAEQPLSESVKPINIEE